MAIEDRELEHKIVMAAIRKKKIEFKNNPQKAIDFMVKVGIYNSKTRKISNNYK